MKSDSPTDPPTTASGPDSVVRVNAPDRDQLALVRTDLANERTLLAYGRTSLMMAGTGATVIKFFADLPGVLWIGGSLIGIGVICGVVGMGRFLSLKRRLRSEG